ncbi:SIS domain-containing protein [Marinactinospora rubrisoli]|uniref:SIS domain-containing protein n=1 Tax=Marinactinospora rubrisoli TaxID=2715399 RepID=A0ABW2KC35_9ACTN
MPPEFDESRLDDLSAETTHGAGGLLRQAASAAAQVRVARSAALEAPLHVLADDGRPRSIVVVGSGPAAFAGEMLDVLLGPGCPVAVHTVRDHPLPGWVGGHDLVIAVAAGGSDPTEQTVRLAAEAIRRGCRLAVVGPADERLAALADQGRAPRVVVPESGEERMSLWALAVPLLTAAAHVTGGAVPGETYEATARQLERIAHECRPTAETFENPAKSLALELAGTLPLAWGGGPVAELAARRFAAQLAANARYPALSGRVPGVEHDQLAALDGPLGGTGPRSIFDDPVEEGPVRLRAVLLRDPVHAEGSEETARALSAVEQAAAERGVPVSTVSTEGRHPMERLAGLIALTDYATLYLAVAYGVDPLTRTLVVR